MATQSLYRRYRPRRFSELKGQDHVVRALRDAVRSGREGQAYLFSGPRGTGKTSSARILAKVLNCEQPVDGEPCCECESCIAVERGTSYDVHELDAASNNGVDAIRDLIEKASLGTPGRHKVYILDEVHMLSRGAEAALLKTLEEPPPHVVFVLATTDPQKMSDTIRSRTQHLQFHLLPADTLAEHVRWVAGDAGLDLDDRALEAAVTRGGGSARDTLSALELMAATGGDTSDDLEFDEFVRAMVDHDPGRALTATAHAVGLGHEPRTLTEALVRHLRDGFLALMAPELVQLPQARIDQIAASALELGAPALVRAIERLGTALVDMRHAPDPRILLEVALVQLTHEATSPDVGPLLERLDRLERALAAGAHATTGTGAPPAPVDASTGRAVLGGRARRAPEATPPDTPPQAPTASSAAAPARPASIPDDRSMTQIWEEQVRPSLKPIVRAIFSAVSLTRIDGHHWHFSAPNAAHGERCGTHSVEVEAALTAVVGAPVALVIDSGGVPAGHDRRDPPAQVPGQTPATGTSTDTGAPEHPGRDEPERAEPEPRHAEPERAEPERVESERAEPEREEDIDLHDLTDAPPESVLTPIDRLAQAFPGAELVDDD
jgi:DNA polymerase III subunit gamma/tau